MKLWGGRFRKEENQMMEDFNSSFPFDQRLYREDITGSIAHARMLGQGLFPKYVHGIYRENDTDMYVGRGLGGPRIGIAPEIVLMELHRA